MNPGINYTQLLPEHLAQARHAAHLMVESLNLAGVLEACERFRVGQNQGTGRPVFYLDDIADIPFLIDIPGVEEYQHRARTRALRGGIYAAVTPDTPGYEDYCIGVLGLGVTEFVYAEPTGANALSVADACSRGPAFSRLREFAREHNGVVIHPYMGCQAIWDLADKLATDSGTSIGVIAPPTPVTWVANDKLQFNQLVEAAVGRQYLVPTETETEPEALAQAMVKTAAGNAQVGLKRTRCASAMGNQVYEAHELQTTADARDRVQAFLRDKECAPGEPVLVVAWEQTNCSPSTQLWIPPVEIGHPSVDGVYEQLLEGETKVFLGSRPSTLPEPVNQALAQVSLLVAVALQHIGYVGRCSFDFVVVGDLHGDFRVLFTECNGRWGGTSTPMQLVDHLVPGPRPTYRAQDFVHPGLVAAKFPDIVSALGEELYDPKTGSGQYILYNVGPLAKSGKLDVIALAESAEAADHAMLERLPRALGL